jgi:hypothetical protein
MRIEPMKTTKPAWTAKLGTEDKTTFAVSESKPFFSYTEMPRTSVSVKMLGKLRRGDVTRPISVLLPDSVLTRLDASIQGARQPSIVALIEYALDTLDRNNQTILVENVE